MDFIVSVSLGAIQRAKHYNFWLFVLMNKKGGSYMADTYYCEKCNRTMAAD
jgi:hypothetical protein